MTQHIAILGGGIAGLAAATLLRRLDPELQLTVLEAGDRTGGKIASRREQGFLTEEGPNSVLDRDGTLRALAEQAGVAPLAQSKAGSRRFVFLRDQLVAAPTGPGALFSSPLLSTRAKLRMLAEPLFAGPRPIADESVLGFATRHVGDEAGTLLARVMARGVFAGDESALSVRAAMPRMAALDAHHRSMVAGALLGRKRGGAPRFMGSFREGLGELTGALTARLGDAVKTGAPVKRLVPRGTRWLVEWGGRSAGEARFDAVVLALPAGASAQLLAECGAAAGREAANALDEIVYAPVTVVHLGYRAADLEHPLDGFGIIGADDTLSPLGILFPSSLFPGRAPEGHALLTLLMGGVRHPERAALGEADAVALAQESVKRILGARGEPRYARVVRHAAAIPQYQLGHRVRIERAEAALRELPLAAFAGAAYHGVGVSEAIASGLRAADQLLLGRPADELREATQPTA